ncbi:hypothetical protein SAMN05660666_03280 [Novosphingobium aromaticivorans]|nr:hypothetical protein [Novosphingobium aromaticivorans]SCY86348.1 hypothetical protein SAMN05660666_03280 [Novosphingobium aromaticivorans]
MWKGALTGRVAYAETIAELLWREHGRDRGAVKQIMKTTGASERTVKHWMSAQHGPETVFFLRLLTSSSVMKAFVLDLIQISQLAAIAPQLTDYPARGPSMLLPSREPRHEKPPDDRTNVPISVPASDPIIDGLNYRQRWFLDRVGSGYPCRAYDLSTHWQVSLKTARRDIAALCSAGKIRYVGARKNGKYDPVG